MKKKKGQKIKLPRVIENKMIPDEETERAKDDRIMRQVGRMKHKDLKTECVLRGMPFKEVVEGSHHGLVSWIFKNFDNPQDNQKLIEFDLWQEDQLKALGYKKDSAFMNPSLRLSYVKGIENANSEKLKPFTVAEKVKKVKEEKPKREVDAKTGIMKGTKKNLTYELVRKGLSINKIIKEVTKQFPDAKEKSIKIWAKRAEKAKA